MKNLRPIMQEVVKELTQFNKLKHPTQLIYGKDGDDLYLKVTDLVFIVINFKEKEISKVRKGNLTTDLIIYDKESEESMSEYMKHLKDFTYGLKPQEDREFLSSVYKYLGEVVLDREKVMLEELERYGFVKEESVTLKIGKNLYDIVFKDIYIEEEIFDIYNDTEPYIRKNYGIYVESDDFIFKGNEKGLYNLLDIKEDIEIVLLTRNTFSK